MLKPSLLKMPNITHHDTVLSSVFSKALNTQYAFTNEVFTMSTQMQHMTYQPIHSVDPLVCVLYQRAADGSAGSGTDVWHGRKTGDYPLKSPNSQVMN